MNVVDLHPEELIDKLAEGRLSNAERERLDAHVATCASCRFEQSVRRDFADELRTARPLPMFVAPPDNTEPAFDLALPAPRARRRRRPLAFLALAAALIGGVSLAALGSRIQWPGSSASLDHGKGSPPPAAEAAPVAPKPEPAPHPVALADLPLARVEPHATPDTGGKHVSTAAELFHEANQARLHGDPHAVTLYRALQARYPSSAEARLSYATLSSLLLDRGDARSALDGFDEYLSHGGAALSEEALVGRALALQKLDDRTAEAAAWRDILRKFPKSIHAKLARTRLLSLGNP